MHDGFLVHERFRHLKRAVLLSVAVIAVYAYHQPLDEPNGGTWFGYTLGGIGAALILWLMWLGVRKRSYKGAFSLRGWLSAHVYLGLALIVVATLHTGFQFGWNLHTLAYTLMMLVITSGLYGVYAYARYPSLMTHNSEGVSMDELVTRIAEIDRECLAAAQPLPDDMMRHVVDASENCRIGGTVRRLLSGTDPNCGTERAFTTLRDAAANVPSDLGPTVRAVLQLLGRKRVLLRTARTDARVKAMLDIWLFFHIPLSFALLAALVGHVLSVFFYW